MSQSKMTLEKFEKFMEALSEHDKKNFMSLISLPNALKVVSGLPDNEYREAAIFGIALKSVVLPTEDDTLNWKLDYNELLLVLTALLLSNEEGLKVYDINLHRAREFTIESREDKENRCTVLRAVLKG